MSFKILIRPYNSSIYHFSITTLNTNRFSTSKQYKNKIYIKIIQKLSLKSSTKNKNESNHDIKFVKMISIERIKSKRIFIPQSHNKGMRIKNSALKRKKRRRKKTRNKQVLPPIKNLTYNAHRTYPDSKKAKV